jgi:hypothetical protein
VVNGAVQGTAVSSFRDYENAYQPHELSMFRRAYEDACFKLGIRPTPSDPADNKRTRDEIATAILYAARLGERGLGALTADAVAATKRYRHAPRR